MKPSDLEIATHEAFGHRPYRDGAGRSAHKRQREEQTSLPVASMDYGLFTGGDDGEHTKGATPFFGGESQATHDDLEYACAMQRRGGPGSNHRNGRVVKQTWLPEVSCQVRQ